MRILVVEDDAAVLSGLVEILEENGHDTSAAVSADDALKRDLSAVDLLLTDLVLPGSNGLELLAEARKRRPSIAVILMTGNASIPTAVEAMKRGALTYLTKPFDPEELLIHVRELAETLKLREQALRGGRGGLVGSSPRMRTVYREIDSAAASDAPVLITGETGTGKELAAHAIHEASARRRGPFVAVNVGAIPRELAESELFGHEAGAFTGAGRKKAGRFALASGGTLFLDEINSLPLDLQPKLLRAIETREIWPLGAERCLNVDIRVIAASNQNLPDRVRRGDFREDLFFRLNVLPVGMPSVSEHPEDIPAICRSLLDRMQAPGESLEISAGALALLLRCEWPGNVRQISNVLERARAQKGTGPRGRIVFDEGDLDVSPPDRDAKVLPFRQARQRAADEWARRRIQATLHECEGNISETARRLRINRNALFRLIKRLGIQRKSVSP